MNNKQFYTIVILLIGIGVMVVSGNRYVEGELLSKKRFCAITYSTLLDGDYFTDHYTLFEDNVSEWYAVCMEKDLSDW